MRELLLVLLSAAVGALVAIEMLLDSNRLRVLEARDRGFKDGLQCGLALDRSAEESYQERKRA